MARYGMSFRSSKLHPCSAPDKFVLYVISWFSVVSLQSSQICAKSSQNTPHMSPISDMDYMDLNVCCLRKAIKLNHSLTHPLGWDIEYLLWVQTQIYILFLSLQWCMQYHVTSDCITTTLTLYWTLLFMFLWSMTILYTGAVITWSYITWYCTQPCSNSGSIYIRIYSQKTRGVTIHLVTIRFVLQYTVSDTLHDTIFAIHISDIIFIQELSIDEDLGDKIYV